VFPPLLYKKDQQRIFIREKNKEMIEICKQILIPYLKINKKLEKIVFVTNKKKENIETHFYDSQNNLNNINLNNFRQNKNSSNNSSTSNSTANSVNNSVNNLSDLFNSDSNNLENITSSSSSSSSSSKSSNKNVVLEDPLVDSLKSVFSCLVKNSSSVISNQNPGRGSRNNPPPSSTSSNQSTNVPLSFLSFSSPLFVDSFLVEHLFLLSPPQKDLSTLIPLYIFLFFFFFIFLPKNKVMAKK
jgi:hypothetical protein